MKKLITAFILCTAILYNAIAQTSQPYKWPAYSPNVRYNFKELNPSFPEPTKILNDCPQVVGEISDRWFVFRWGPNRNPTITDQAIRNMLARMNEDFSYFRNVMGWPADKRARNGYKSAVYLYGSGLCTDNASNTAGGGWQSSIYYNGQSWPMVLASYIPVRSFDPQYNDEFQKGAMVHEGIHAVLADMPGVKQSAWFHEGGNVWLQQTADARRSGNFSSMGNLNATDFMAPFMPIECYSGWLVDGSFGGPSAEGVNKYDNTGKQICTWRTTLGGHQYSSMFPTVLAQILGDGAIPWIWVNCPGRVLEGLGGTNGIGEAQMRRVIVQYRAKMALMDLGEWTNASINLLNANFGRSIGAEWQPAYMQPPLWKVTPYAKTTRSGNTLTPEQTTLPGWSGSNQIPLTVSGNKVTVNFKPTGANMTCQLMYRTTTGVPVYGPYVSSGNCTIDLKAPAANNVVIAVITNTDFIYRGEVTRTTKYNYTLDLVEGVTGAADINTRWYESARLDDLRTVTFSATVVNGTGGSVSPEASGYLIGDTAVVTAYPLPGYTFAGWGGNASGMTNPIKIVMNANKTVTATFTYGQSNTAPTVSITSPANNATFTAPASITINANAADADGTVSNVQFFNGATLLGSDAAAPYSFTWTNVPAGTYTLTAKATDNANAVTTSTAVTVVVNPVVNTPPTVSITSPVNNATFPAPASITINANAADANGTVTNVQFFNGTTLLGSDASAPYSFVWTNVAAGTYTLTARTTDNAGAITTSAAITVTVSVACIPTAITPYVQINGGAWAQTSGANLNAGGSVRFGPQPITGGSWRWSGPNGYSATTREITLSNIQASATYIATYTNAAGCNSTQTFTVSVVVPNQAPTVAITSPANNATFLAPASITINANAADADGAVSNVQFFNGTTLLGSDATSPYSFVWTNVSAGTHSISARVTDNNGMTSNSAVVNVIVNSPPANVTIQAETACAVTGILSETKNAGFNGAGYVNFDNAAGTSASWSLSSAVSQTVGLTIRYANASVNNRTMSVVVNGVTQVASVNFLSTGSWTTWSTVSIHLNLTQGSNTLRFVSLMSEGGPNIDELIYQTGTVASGSCSTARLASIEEPSSILPNPSTDVFTLTVLETVESFIIMNDHGVTVCTGGTIKEGESLHLGQELQSGLYLVYIQYSSGRVEAKKIQKVQ